MKCLRTCSKNKVLPPSDGELKNGRSQRFSLVPFRDPEAAEKALTVLIGKDISTRACFLIIYLDKTFKW